MQSLELSLCWEQKGFLQLLNVNSCIWIILSVIASQIQLSSHSIFPLSNYLLALLTPQQILCETANLCLVLSSHWHENKEASNKAWNYTHNSERFRRNKWLSIRFYLIPARELLACEIIIVLKYISPITSLCFFFWRCAWLGYSWTNLYRGLIYIEFQRKNKFFKLSIQMLPSV